MNFKEQYNQIFGEPTKGSLDELQYKKLELFVKIEEQKTKRCCGGKTRVRVLLSCKVHRR